MPDTPPKRSLRQAAREGSKSKAPAVDQAKVSAILGSEMEPVATAKHKGRSVSELIDESKAKHADLEAVRMTQAGGNPKTKPPPCEKCIKRAETDRIQHEENRLAKERRKANGGKVKRQHAESRLPDSSSFVSHYDAAAKMWTVSLAVPSGNATKLFQVTCSGIFRALSQLDRQYRDWLKAEAAKAEPSPETALDTAEPPQ